MTDDSDILISIAPSAGRRYLGVGSLVVLAVIMLPLVFEAQGLWSLMFLAMSIAVLLAARGLWRATADRIELTRSELRTSSGRVLTPVANVNGVDRGAFAFKPSNGFLVKLKEPAGKGWAPGLWWQRGRLIGVGGVIPGGQSRAMAELLTALINGTFDELMK